MGGVQTLCGRALLLQGKQSSPGRSMQDDYLDAFRLCPGLAGETSLRV